MKTLLLLIEFFFNFLLASIVVFIKSAMMLLAYNWFIITYSSIELTIYPFIGLYLIIISSKTFNNNPEKEINSFPEKLLDSFTSLLTRFTVILGVKLISIGLLAIGV